MRTTESTYLITKVYEYLRVKCSGEHYVFHESATEETLNQQLEVPLLDIGQFKKYSQGSESNSVESKLGVKRRAKSIRKYTELY